MRLRNVRGAREEMLVNPYVIQEPQQYRGHVAVQIFGNNNPIFIEVGMGKGQFITSLAALHPEINYIGIEKYSSVLIRAIEKQEELQLPNLKFLRFDAEYLPDIFAPGEIAHIYLNFSVNMSKMLTCTKNSCCQNILINTCKNRLWKPHKT